MMIVPYFIANLVTKMSWRFKMIVLDMESDENIYCGLKMCIKYIQVNYMCFKWIYTCTCINRIFELHQIFQTINYIKWYITVYYM